MQRQHIFLRDKLTRHFKSTQTTSKLSDGMHLPALGTLLAMLVPKSGASLHSCIVYLKMFYSQYFLDDQPSTCGKALRSPLL